LNRSIFLNWNFNNFKKFEKKLIKSLNLNFGPQHPATHGVLRLILQLNNEYIEKIDCHIGYLHRGNEKLFEKKSYLQNLPYFDRFDYMTMFCHEHVYCLSVESLLNKLNYSSTLTIIRTIFDEISRILNHTLALACHALDVGSMTPIFWIFEEREKLLEFCEKFTGARMHSIVNNFNFLKNNFFSMFNIYNLVEFGKNFFFSLNELHNILSYNKIWKQRLINILNISLVDCLNYGLTGIISRSCGLKRDLRLYKNESYNNYYFLNFKGYIGLHGDCYDRYLIRINEMSESIFLIFQLLQKFYVNFYVIKENIIKNKNYNLKYILMENVISHFKYWNNFLKIKNNFSYMSIESPKGELGLSILSNNTKFPWKCKLRSPGFIHLQYLNNNSINYFLSDLITIIGSIDIVFGEIDK